MSRRSRHWQWCMIYGFEMCEKYYEHFVGKEMSILENDGVKILRGFSILQQRRKLTVMN